MAASRVWLAWFAHGGDIDIVKDIGGLASNPSHRDEQPATRKTWSERDGLRSDKGL